MDESFESIKNMPLSKFRSMLHNKISEAALIYLTDKQRIKGGEINYEGIQMAEYLLPNNSGLTNQEQQKIFEIRNKVVRIPDNFSSRKKKSTNVNVGTSKT